MVPDANHFELEFEQGKMHISRHSIGSQVIFSVIFSNKKSPLIVTRVLQPNGNKFWTSVPEGRQREAEEVGH